MVPHRLRIPDLLPVGAIRRDCVFDVTALPEQPDHCIRTRERVFFHSGLELRVFEYLDLSDGELLHYSYTIYRGTEKIRWYDPQPHPDNAELASTFPHHRHEPPNTPVPEAQRSGIKQNRRPAPGIAFTAPNLPTLIADCVELGKA